MRVGRCCHAVHAVQTTPRPLYADLSRIPPSIERHVRLRPLEPHAARRLRSIVVNAIGTALLVFAVVLGATLLGSSLGRKLPRNQVTGETWSSVSLGIGFISTMAAIVLGLLVASAKASYDTKHDEVQSAAAKLIVLDRTLRQYGTEAEPVRALLLDRVKSAASMRWLKGDEASSGARTAPPPPTTYGYEQIWLSVRTLAPANDVQRALQARALETIDQLGQMRWLLTAQSSEGISTPMLVALVVWLAVIAGCAGVFAPRHRTMFVVALLCAMAVSGTIFLLMELYDPFGGVMRMSNAPMQTALDALSRP